MLLHVVVRATEQVAATSSRLAKVEILAGLLRGLDRDEIRPVVGFLLGSPRQGRTGVGWRTISHSGSVAADDPTLTVGDLDTALTELAGLGGAGSASRRRTVLGTVLGRATSAEQDFVGRVLIGDMRTGALQGVLIDAVAKAADLPAAVTRRATMLRGDLGAIAELALTEGEAAVEGVGLTVGVPVQPMLASTAADPTAALAVTGLASVEFKLDGARIQVHREGEAVTIYTRTLADVTHRLPEIVEVVRSYAAESFILDGETLSLSDDGSPRPFQDTMSRFGADKARIAILQPFFFDVLHLDGADLIDRPLAERQATLHALVGDDRIPGTTTADPATADDVAARALAAGHEGIMVKGLNSTYAAGRRGKHWVKVKPVHTFDLVVLAAEWGYGRRGGWLSNLHLGARDPDGLVGEAGGLVMVGKTFKGLTDELLRWQTEHFPTLESRRTASTVYVRPEVLVEVAIDGVQRSSRYPGGLALRFARVKRYRDDKPVADADTIASLRTMLPPRAPGS